MEGGGITRRSVLNSALALPVAAHLAAPARGSESPAPGRRGPRVAVVGAGAFGGWTALWLQRRGARVTLLDAWGPGNSRSSSGGETRVLRSIYGADRLYMEWVARSLRHWRELEGRCGQRFYRPLGALWMFGADDAYARAALPVLRDLELPAEELSPAAARARFPQVEFDGVRSVFVEREAGYLAARRACQTVADLFVAEGGEWRDAAARPGASAGGRLRDLALDDGSRLEADLFVFACGPWLGELFPDVLGGALRVTRQEVFYFGPPAEERRFDEARFPVWLDFGERVVYGIPGNERRGFKFADDTRGAAMDPTGGEREVSAPALALARAHLERRFPGLARSPLLEARVCQYENSPDGHFLAGRHPQAENLWLLGGGSGHGFKLAPALGEEAARWILDDAAPPALFALGRLAALAGLPPRSQFQSGILA